VRTKTIILGAIAALALATLTANAGNRATHQVQGSLVSLVAATTTVTKTDANVASAAAKSAILKESTEAARKPVVAARPAPKITVSTDCQNAINALKALRQADAAEDTLNYNIRMLGRRGVLVLNAVASMSELPQIEKSTPQILSAIDFNPGNRYADFNAASGDKVATYGLAALVAGGVAAKLGLFKGLWVLILGAKKFLIIAALAMAAWFRKLFGRKKDATEASGQQPS